MKFALITHLPWPEGVDVRSVAEQTLAEVAHGEALGFHSAWFAEHHFSRYGIGSSALVFASAIAARTAKIRLGTAVLVPPLHNPIRLAEDTATLDLMSDGRLDVGFGRGAARYEFTPYGVDHSDTQARFQESVNMIQGMWTTPDYTRKGRYYSVHQANLVPPVVQQPHPPIYIAATRTQATLEYAVERGFPTMIGLTVDTEPALELCRRYEAMSAKTPHRIAMAAIPFFRYCYVAESEQKALDDVRQSLSWVIDMLQWRGAFSEGSELTHSLDEWRKTRGEPALKFEDVFEKRSVIGTPRQCVAKIKALQAQGIEYFGCNFAFGGMPHRKVMDAMTLFAEEVMPRFAG